jgi:hypothetical protein
MNYIELRLMYMNLNDNLFLESRHDKGMNNISSKLFIRLTV